MRRPVDLILPDTGPLITLAAADRLELLASFGRPVMIPDVIREEATAKPGTPGYDRLKTWFGGAGHNQFKIIDTPLIDVYRHLRTQPDAPDGTPAAHGLGEATLMWTIVNVERFHARDTMCLVLTEDGRAGEQMPEGVHVLSTRSWLTGLQRLAVIRSAKDVIDDVIAKGRTPSPYSRDQRGRDQFGNTTDWTKNAVLPEKSPTPKGARQPTTKKEDEDEKDDNEPTDADSIVKIFITREELASAIALSKSRSDGVKTSKAGSVASILVEAGDSVSFKSHRSENGKDDPGKVFYGTEALTTLERGFGRTRYRSLEIDPKAIKSEDWVSKDFSARLEIAIKATEGRASRSPDARPAALQRKNKGRGD